MEPSVAAELSTASFKLSSSAPSPKPAAFSMSNDPSNLDRTLAQGREERSRAQERSLQPSRPPLEVPGYRAERFLGAGAYGQVWVAVEMNTGRRVSTSERKLAQLSSPSYHGGQTGKVMNRSVRK